MVAQEAGRNQAGFAEETGWKIEREREAERRAKAAAAELAKRKATALATALAVSRRRYKENQV